MFKTYKITKDWKEKMKELFKVISKSDVKGSQVKLQLGHYYQCKSFYNGHQNDTNL